MQTTATSSAAKFQKAMRTARCRLKMAEIYLEDGAPASAATCLREAADHFEKAANIKASAFAAA